MLPPDTRMPASPTPSFMMLPAIPRMKEDNASDFVAGARATEIRAATSRGGNVLLLGAEELKPLPMDSNPQYLSNRQSPGEPP
jgi:hypothetical protein